MLDIEKVAKGIVNGAQQKAVKTVLDPLNGILDDQLTDISTTLGLFMVRAIRGRFQRSITFSIGNRYSDRWMEEALYGILYQYNNIKKSPKLELTNKAGINDGSGMYFRLNDGTHNLKYRNYDILLNIQTKVANTPTYRTPESRVYTIITYDLSPEFVRLFERDMLIHRNSLLKIKSDSTTVAVYKDLHENDGYTYWEKTQNIPKRRIGTIYIPESQKRQLVDTINDFFARKKFYNDHGIAHNLKILLYGPPGPQPVSMEIPTPNGMRRFGDIKPGDYVFGMNGQPTIVEEVYEYKNLDVYEVEFSDGRKTLCAGDHKFPCVTSRGNFVDKSVYQMLEEGLTEKGFSRYASDMPSNQVPIGACAEFPWKKVPIDPWVYGAIIGVGELVKDEPLVLKFPTAINPRLVMSRIGADTIEKRSDDPNDHGWIFIKDGKPITANDFILTEDGIDDRYIYNSRDVRFGFINGLMDSAGAIEESGVSSMNGKRYNVVFKSTSKKLMEQLTFIIRSLGFSLDVNYDRLDPNLGTMTIRCTDSDKYLFFRYSHKITKAFKARYRKPVINSRLTQTMSIVRITSLGRKEDMHCLHVEDPMHLYLTSDFIVTCNSGKDSIAKMIASEWNRNIYYITGGKNGKYIPNAIVDADEDVNYPLMLISDIDKYPSVITEAKVDMDEDGKAKDEQMQYKQTFGNMINALDGVLSAEGRIIVMTTNHVEKFSEVLMRPGRIDLAMEIGYVTPEVFRKYVQDFYHIQLPENIKLKDKDLTVAKMQYEVVFLKMKPDEFIKNHVR